MASRITASRMRKRVESFGHTADGVVLIDENQKIVYCNQAAGVLLGYAAGEAVGRFCYDVLAGQCCGALVCRPGCRVQRAAQRGILPQAFDMLATTRDGASTWVNVSTIILPDKGRRPAVVHLIRSAEQQKRHEEAIRQLFVTLGPGHLPDDSVPRSKAPAPSGTSVCPANVLWALTRREFEVLSLLTEGLTTPEIAKQMGVSAFTVRNHIQNAITKLNVGNRTQAVAVAFANGLRP